ncbi:methylated-DNA--[protein]-cysteine S-methyltransferase [Pontiella sulfatireligans]|uniref:methylated-DNA--[protein]-cysteine S-methyltransferase n=1 Tax=Pontiella sulfatireligans TaxID=2750658 RepID=A0A6C2UV99_9BACT|nr:methylated-DNA--[protein]-cysteine S-methyltransferase [Pontiella sulfatireligans]VGO23321.1 Methylated-DNA--protein-cysteine methyltransferase [Pontiella sulfatireligans]
MKIKRHCTTTWGVITVCLEDGAVTDCTLPFLEEEPAEGFAILEKDAGPEGAFIEAVFSGRTVKNPPAVKLKGTGFQQLVWRAIADTPKGQTKTYGELAKAVGRPRACRAVANACGRNPAPLFFPCHRIVGANENMGGFSAGLPWKRLLLNAEH